MAAFTNNKNSAALHWGKFPAKSFLVVLELEGMGGSVSDLISRLSYSKNDFSISTSESFHVVMLETFKQILSWIVVLNEYELCTSKIATKLIILCFPNPFVFSHAEACDKDLKFQPGLDTNLFEVLKLRIKALEEEDRDVAIRFKN